MSSIREDKIKNVNYWITWNLTRIKNNSVRRQGLDLEITSRLIYNKHTRAKTCTIHLVRNSVHFFPLQRGVCRRVVKFERTNIIFKSSPTPSTLFSEGFCKVKKRNGVQWHEQLNSLKRSLLQNGTNGLKKFLWEFALRVTRLHTSRFYLSISPYSLTYLR